MSKSKVRGIGFFVIVFLFLSLMLPISQTSAKTIVDKKTNKVYRLIETREELLKEFKSHVFSMDQSFKIYVSSNVVKNFSNEFKGIWSDLIKDEEFNEIWKHNKVYEAQFKDYSKTKAKCWEWNIKKMTFGITKEEADDLLVNFRNKISSKDDLVKAYTTRVLGMQKNITLYITKKAMKNFSSEYDAVVKKLNKNSEYKNMMRYARVISSKPYDLKSYWKWNIQLEYYLSPETASELKNSSHKIIKNLEELEKNIVLHSKRLDRRIISKVDSKVLNFSNEVQYNNFWTKLYKNPEFIDIFFYSKNFKHKLIYHKNYTEWIMDLDYKISDKDIQSLDSFIDSTVRHLLNGVTSPESKVKMIMDFMSKNYAIFYGDKGAKWYFTGTNSAKAMVGKYNVNTGFALYKEKKGTSDAFANLFYKFAKAAGIDAKVVVGKRGGNRFSWNMVNLSGKWYHLATIHDKDSKIDLQSTYLKSNKTMKKFFAWDEKDYPVAKKDY